MPIFGQVGGAQLQIGAVWLGKSIIVIPMIDHSIADDAKRKKTGKNDDD